MSNILKINHMGSASRDGRLAALRLSIRAIEMVSPVSGMPQVETAPGPGVAGVPAGEERSAFWGFGVEALDGQLGPRGLEVGGIHEFKPALPISGQHWTSGWAAAQGVALGLAGQRLRSLQAGAGRAILWCVPVALAREFGCPYGGGLATFGIAPSDILIVTPGRVQDALWVLEEGLNGGGLALVAGLIDEVGLTSARRLALAAQKRQTPCLLITNPRTPGTAATMTRWRTAASGGSRNPLVAEAPGPLRVAVGLERCRARGVLASERVFTLEWSDEAYRFRMVADVADRTHAPPAALPA